MNTFEKITRARELLDLPEQVTLKEIKANYRVLIKKWHPDKCRSDHEQCAEMTAKLAEAYKLLTRYTNNYRFSFSEEEVMKYLPKDEWWLAHFGQDPV